MTDPRTDPRASALMMVSLEAIQQLIDDYSAATRRASFAARGLRAARGETIWFGTAADQFVASIGQLPRRLDAILNSYYGVQEALTRYQSDIEQLQSDWQSAVTAITDASGPASSAEAGYQRLNGEYRQLAGEAARGVQGAAAQLQQLAGQLRAAAIEVDRTAPALQGAYARAQDILERFDESVTTLTARTADAGLKALDDSVFTALGAAVGGAVGSVGSYVGSGRHHAGGHGQAPAEGRLAPVPVTVRERLSRMDGYVKAVMGTAYASGGGHSSFSPNGGLHRSTFVPRVLDAAGLLGAGAVTGAGAVPGGMLAGHGKYVTVYDRTDCPVEERHVIIDINGQYYEEGGAATSGALDVHRFTPSAEFLASFDKVLHPAGM